MMKVLARYMLPAAMLVNMNCFAAENLNQTPPSAKELLQILFQSYSLDIKSLPHCETAFSDAQDVRLGDYLAGHLANFAEEADNQIVHDCVFAQQQWRCLLSFRHNIPNREVFFNYGVRFSLTPDRRLAENSLSCWGSG